MATVALWLMLEEGFPRVYPPYEDAAMLFRYADNLASGGGLAWNAGESPAVTDGATDLGFVLVLAALVWLGVQVQVAALALNTAAVFATGVLLDVMNRRVWQLPAASLSLVTLVIFSGPANRYLASGFSPPIFAFIIAAATVLAALSAAAKVGGSRWQVLLAASGVCAGIAGWWRPEGFVLSSIMVAPAWLMLAPDRSWRRLIRPVLLFVVPLVVGGLAWVAFRVGYIGQLLPTSAVMKSGEGIYPGSVLEAAGLYLLWTAPLTVIVWNRQKWWARVGWKGLVVVGALLVAAVVWLPVHATFNHWERMQWPLVPALAILMVSALSDVAARRAVAGPVPSLTALVAVGLCMALALYSHVGNGYQESPFHTAVSRALSGVDTSSLRLATTEAGLIPLSVSGKALDTWGHNDRSLAESRRGTLEQRLQEFEPNVLIVHGFTAPPAFAEIACRSGGDWSDMVSRLYSYADHHDLRLLRSTAMQQCDFWTVYVGPGVSPDIVDALRSYRLAGEELVALPS
ncbi:hypothetical protein [Propioniciclava soli]|uniref:hypothetical protein n=1 Tax=Propioniciclava soli TaxID=2775081 RepID=UPI001E3312A1|nr:hypothetical protein [Propioniciclava soli]